MQPKSKAYLIIGIFIVIGLLFARPSFAGQANANADADASATTSQGQNQGQNQQMSQTANPQQDQAQQMSQTANPRQDQAQQQTANPQNNFQQDINYQGDHFSQTFEASEQKRPMPGGMIPGMPGLAAYFANVPMTHEYVRLAKMADVKSEWNEQEVESWAKPEDLNNVVTRVRTTGELGSSKEFKFVFVKPEDYRFVGVVEANTNEEGAPMEAVFSMMAQSCLEKGGNVMFPLNEGARRVLKASGWGVALGFTHSTISGGPQKNAGVSAIGLGYSKAETGYNHEPFARAAILRVDEQTYANLRVFPEGNGNKLAQQNEQLRRELQRLKEIVRQQTVVE